MIMRSITEPFGFVYLTTNWINGKRYIGQRVFDPKGKWRRYLGSGVLLHKALDKHGRDNFTKEIIDIAYSQGDLDLKEEFWIHNLSAVSSDDYYNVSEGERGYQYAGYDEETREFIIQKNKESIPRGSAHKKSKLTEKDVDEIIVELLNGERCSDIAKKYNVHDSTIGNIKLHHSWRHKTEGIEFPEAKLNPGQIPKPVKQYNCHGELIREYPSILVASKETGILQTTISRACAGVRSHARNTLWCFSGEEDMISEKLEKYNNRHPGVKYRPVELTNIETGEILYFSYAIAAMKILNITEDVSRQVSNACKNKKVYKGYLWSYIYPEDERYIDIINKTAGDLKAFENKLSCEVN